MAEIRRRRRVRSAGADVPSSTPAPQDEADIVAEVGAEAAEDDSGELVIDEATALKEGALDAETIIENRHAAEVNAKKRGNVKNVGFNISNVLVKYEEVSKTYPTNTMDILVTRLTGSQIVRLITSRPRTGAELYEALKAIHGRSEEAEYELKFRDHAQKTSRGTGRIVMPDTRDEIPAQQPQGPVMNHYPFPPPYGQPYVQPAPGYPQPQILPPGYVAPPQPQAPAPAPQAAPAPPPPPPMPPPGTDVETARRWFDLWQQMNPQAPQGPAPTPQVQPQPQPPMMPPPPPGAVVYVPGYGWMQAVGAAPASPQPAPPPPPAPAAPTAMAPEPPPGTVFVYGLGYVHPAIAQAMGVGSNGAAPQRPGPPFRGPYQGPRPPYSVAASAHDMGAPNGFEEPRRSYPGYPGGGPQQQSAPPTPKSAMQEVREAISLVKMVGNMAEETQSIWGGGREAPEPAQPTAEPDDSPVRVMEVGDVKLVLDKESGGARGFETVFANIGPILKWAGELPEKIRQSQQREAPPQRQQQLPPGYVELTPDFRAPPGYVAVPVAVPAETHPQHAVRTHVPMQTQAPMPPPPAYVPPPIGEMPPEQEPIRVWATPVPGEE